MRRWFVALLCFMVVCVLGLGITLSVHADSAADIQAQIDSHNKQIADLEAEIAGYQKQLNALGTQHQTLQTSIQSIDVSRSKITAQITVLQNKISALSLELGQLNSQILDKQQTIELDKKAVAQSVRNIDLADNSSIIEHIFSDESLADVWLNADNLTTLNGALRKNTSMLADATVELTNQQNQVQATKKDLSNLNDDLSNQQHSLDVTKQVKQQLLTQTKSQESAYQALIAQKKAQQKAFESELSALEDSLKVVVDPSLIPHVGSGVLVWPFSSSVMNDCKGKAGALGNEFCITQYFGNTPFATANPQIYNGIGHDGIDIGVPIGTPVLAALTGTVLGTGNTDAVPGCYSFGKWVMVKHANGINTMYAHLSSISVTAGQAVATGQLLGYSGMTGYATGPHLHFGVYASQATQVMTLQQFRGATSPCANATMPVAPKTGYLNPMSYL